MAYPKNDSDFRDFIVGQVFDRGDWWQVYSACGLDESTWKKAVGPRPKIGWKYRVYAWEGFERGIYVAGRVARPYRTPEQMSERARRHAEKFIERMNRF